MRDDWLQRYPKAAAMLQGEGEILDYDATLGEDDGEPGGAEGFPQPHLSPGNPPPARVTLEADARAFDAAIAAASAALRAVEPVPASSHGHPRLYPVRPALPQIPSLTRESVAASRRARETPHLPHAWLTRALWRTDGCP